MVLLVSYLKMKNNCFLVKNDDKVFEVSEKKVESILITTSATITTDAIKFAVENNIDIVFLDKFGDPYGRVWHSKLGSTTYIRRRQLEISDEPEGFKLAKGWVIQKVENQVQLLKDLKKKSGSVCSARWINALITGFWRIVSSSYSSIKSGMS